MPTRHQFCKILFIYWGAHLFLGTSDYISKAHNWWLCLMACIAHDFVKFEYWVFRFEQIRQFETRESSTAHCYSLYTGVCIELCKWLWLGVRWLSPFSVSIRSHNILIDIYAMTEVNESLVVQNIAQNNVNITVKMKWKQCLKLHFETTDRKSRILLCQSRRHTYQSK